MLGDPTLCQIAQELVRRVRAKVTEGWTVRTPARAYQLVLVKCILCKRGHCLRRRAEFLHLRYSPIERPRLRREAG
ncbi:MAG: hypothetical protein C4289_08330, partial [Chloroflexota bacterium]